MTKAEQRRLAAEAAQNHAITVLPAGVARAPGKEADDSALPAVGYDPAALADEIATAAATPASARSRGTGHKGWAKADAVYHADDAVIEYVAPNPKKSGSATHSRFAQYAVGRTIAQVKALGVTAGDILWDLPRGFIRLAAPTQPTAE